jgi:hypothetical protein
MMCGALYIFGGISDFGGFGVLTLEAKFLRFLKENPSSVSHCEGLLV